MSAIGPVIGPASGPATCPTCGVAVVSGYVRCPKCGATLPVGRRATTPISAGGTALPSRGGFPVIPVAAGVAVLLVVVLVLALRGGENAPSVVAGDEEEATEPAAEVDDPSPENLEPAGTTPAAAGPDPAAAASDLDRNLKRERLWGTVQISGARVDVRSGACNDPGMGPVLDAAIAPLRDAGLTKLRCLEQSGAVVFERDL